MSLRQLLYILLALIAGILIGHMNFASLWLSIGFIICGVLSFTISLLISRQNRFFPSQGIYNEITSILIFCGVGVFSAQQNKPTPTLFSESEYYFEGIIKDYIPTNYGDKVLVHLTELKQKKINNPTKSIRNINALLTLEGGGVINYGDKISGWGKLSSIDKPSNYLKDDYEAYLRTKHIYLSGFIKEKDYKIFKGIKSPAATILKIRYDLEAFIEKTPLDIDTKNFIISILLGDKSYIKKEDRLKFSDAGVSHIFAVSGLHVSMIGMFLLSFLSIFFRRESRKWKYLICLPLIWGYVLIVGASPASCRAGIMLTIGLTALFLQRKNDAVKALLWSVFIILAFNSDALYDIGFQLSVVCVGSLLIIVQPLNFINHRYHPRLHNLVSIVLVTLTATFSSWLICAFYFHRFSLMFLPLNLIAVPLLPAFIILAVVYLGLYCLGLNIGIIGKLLDISYSEFDNMAEAITSNNVTFEGLYPHWLSVCLWVASLIIIAVILRNSYKKKYLWLPATLCLLGIMTIPLLGNRPKDGIIIQKNSKETTLMVYENGTERLVTLPNGKTSGVNLLGKRILSLSSPMVSEEAKRELLKADIILLIGKQNKLSEEVGNLKKKEALIVTHPTIHWRYEKKLLEAAWEQDWNIHSLRYDGPLHLFD